MGKSYLGNFWKAQAAVKTAGIEYGSLRHAVDRYETAKNDFSRRVALSLLETARKGYADALKGVKKFESDRDMTVRELATSTLATLQEGERALNEAFETARKRDEAQTLKELSAELYRVSSSGAMA